MTGDLLRRAYRYCEWVTVRHYENFPVASWLLPKAIRPHVAAVYAFARSADDFADEARYHGRSLELLDQWRTMLWTSCGEKPPRAGTDKPALTDRAGMESRAISEGRAREGESELSRRGNERTAVRPGSAGGDGTHPIFLALADTVRRYELPVRLLDDLLTAFTMDVTQRRYDDWPGLMNYCRYSANPVGRLVLLLSRIREEELHRRSDGICSALQLANHWQDLRIDLARDILYIPRDLMRSHGVTESELRNYSPRPGAGSFALGPSGLEGTSRRKTPPGPQRSLTLLPGGAKVPLSPQFRSLMKELVARTRALFDSGEPLVKHLKGGLRLEIQLTLLGGRTLLDRIEAADYDVFRHRPVISTADKVGLFTRALVA